MIHPREGENMGREDELQPSNINQTMQLTLPADHAYDVLKNMLSCSAMFMMGRWNDEKNGRFRSVPSMISILLQ